MTPRSLSAYQDMSAGLERVHSISLSDTEFGQFETSASYGPTHMHGLRLHSRRQLCAVVMGWWTSSSSEPCSETWPILPESSNCHLRRPRSAMAQVSDSSNRCVGLLSPQYVALLLSERRGSSSLTSLKRAEHGRSRRADRNAENRVCWYIARTAAGLRSDTLISSTLAPYTLQAPHACKAHVLQASSRRCQA